MPLETPTALLSARFVNQRLLAPHTADPAALVHWLMAVQSQDYTGAVWAIGVRAPDLVAADVHQAFDDGRILRTHVLRPTWHFVSPADIRWLLTLTAPRVHAVGAPYLRKAELTPPVLNRCLRLVERALTGGAFLTRAELGAVLQRAGIAAPPGRLSLIAMHAELEQVICSGPRRGKQFTYALLEERVAPAPARTRDEALAELTTRYAASHGPATLHDLAWWSGLPLRDVKAGVALAGPALAQATVNGLTYWFAAGQAPGPARASGTWLLPNYDEALIAYKDRGLSVVPSPGTAGRGNPIFAHQVVLDGRVVGSWSRTVSTTRVVVDVAMYDGAPTPAIVKRLTRATTTMARFLDCPVSLTTARR